MAEIKKQASPKVTVNTTTTAKQKVVTPVKKPVSVSPVLFEKENFMWMIIGGAIILLGMLLMSGGKNVNPDVFDYKVVYSFTRVTLAPILIVGGLMVEIYAIFKKTKQSPNV